MDKAVLGLVGRVGGEDKGERETLGAAATEATGIKRVRNQNVWIT